jgi:hypothetical protein
MSTLSILKRLDESEISFLRHFSVASSFSETQSNSWTILYKRLKNWLRRKS